MHSKEKQQPNDLMLFSSQSSLWSRQSHPAMCSGTMAAVSAHQPRQVSPRALWGLPRGRSWGAPPVLGPHFQLSRFLVEDPGQPRWPAAWGAAAEQGGHETGRETMREQSKAGLQQQRGYKGIFKGFSGGEKTGAGSIHINEPETILKNNLLSSLRSKEHGD